MTLADRLQSDMTTAMRDGDALRRDTLRMVLAAAHNAQVAARRPLSDDEILGVLAKEAKSRRESIEAYTGAGRPDLADKERAEVGVISVYLPAALTEDELRAMVADAIAATGAVSARDLGKVMGRLSPLIRGRADGKQVSGLVAQELARLDLAIPHPWRYRGQLAPDPSMLARRSSRLTAFGQRDAVRLLMVGTPLVTAVTFILAAQPRSVAVALDPARITGWALFAALVVASLLAWMWRFRPGLWHRNRALLLVALVLVGSTLLLRVTADRSVLPYIAPVATGVLLLSVLLDAGVALAVLATLAVLAGSVTGQPDVAAYVFLGAMAGIVVLRRGERLTQYAQAAVAMAVVNIVAVSAFALLNGSDLPGLVQLVLASVAAAAGSAVAAAGTFAILGSVFGITTSYQLMELANPSQPLLRRLLLEAPGTYHHSLMVGNLGERAAEAIGADPLVVRVAAYYHDIGKLADPSAFIENQPTGQANPHDEMAPEESARVLAAHVANGIDIAYEYKLPKPIISFIPQHHGTGRMSYFYEKAREEAVAAAGAVPGSAAAQEAADAVDERRFRHMGPKPQSREAAILMLADSVEASVRSLSNHDEASIRSMVGRIIGERLEDGQFDECDLTLRDLDHIREAFIAQLLGMYHRRIEYPQNKIVELESRRVAS